jgi:hypothetical protein
LRHLDSLAGRGNDAAGLSGLCRIGEKNSPIRGPSLNEKAGLEGWAEFFEKLLAAAVTAITMSQ